LKNASKFTPEEGTIRVVSRNEGGRIIVLVHDTGVGFEPGEAPRIFTAFEQANESVSREFGGLGLGLAIVKATVEAHGGTIRAHSAGKARGATFCLELTLVDKGTNQ
jgi:signal transduction histidine kinase